MDIIVLHETPPHPDPLPQGARGHSLPRLRRELSRTMGRIK